MSAKITLVTAVPGGGKTSWVVDTVAHTKEYHGRKLYAVRLPNLALEHEILDDETLHRWHEPGVVEDGSIIIVDEAQETWPKAPNGSKVPPDLAALNTHRHRGIDLFVITQGPHLLHSNVKALVGRHVHFRDNGVLGRWRYEWPTVCSNPDTAFKQAPIKLQHHLPKRSFKLYRSASMHVKSPKVVPRTVFILGAALLALGFFGVRAYASIKAKSEPKPQVEAPADAASQPQGRAPKPRESEPASAPVEAVAEVAAPAVAGCISLGTRCICYDTQGVQITVETAMCYRSSQDYSGLVPLVGVYASQRQVPVTAAAASAPRPPSSVGGVLGFSAGDYRDRAPRQPVGMPAAGV